MTGIEEKIGNIPLGPAYPAKLYRKEGVARYVGTLTHLCEGRREVLRLYRIERPFIGDLYLHRTDDGKVTKDSRYAEQPTLMSMASRIMGSSFWV